MLNIEWRTIKGYEGLYEVSNDGMFAYVVKAKEKQQEVIFGVMLNKINEIIDKLNSMENK